MSAARTERSGDPRPPALGIARLLFVAFVLFGIYALYREILLTALYPSTWMGARIVSFLAVFVWFLGTAGVIHNGRRMRIVAWASFLFETLGIICVTLIGIYDVRVATSVTMWGMAGAYYSYIPIVGSVAAIAWLVSSNPRRLAGR